MKCCGLYLHREPVPQEAGSLSPTSGSEPPTSGAGAGGAGPRRVRLVVNLGMTGRLLVQEPGAGEPPTHPAVRFELENGGTLWYHDPRRFGTLEVMGQRRWREWEGAMGPEPLSSRYSAARLHEHLQRSRSPIRSWLLDQRRIAGVGNLYASEALFTARVHPARPANTLSVQEAASLHRALRSALRRAIQHRGTTLRDYRDPLGGEGGNAPLLRAYGREGLPCRRCRTPLERLVLSNRSAFFCPRCQPEPA